MTKEQYYRKKFYGIVNFLDCCSDTFIKNEHGVTMERGITVNENDAITYHLENNTINFYVDNKEVLSITEDSPLISMFEGLLLSMEE